jgi:hypothetical protein
MRKATLYFCYCVGQTHGHFTDRSACAESEALKGNMITNKFEMQSAAGRCESSRTTLAAVASATPENLSLQGLRGRTRV